MAPEERPSRLVSISYSSSRRLDASPSPYLTLLHREVGLGAQLEAWADGRRTWAFRALLSLRQTPWRSICPVRPLMTPGM
ncbi:hypothetical protein PsYK624_050690 [Phanerochaete sordida]|uniref:Uncharacterized protein n=1 Tax=Phanerochaete sordida TaxID=48140 RepID=A0A9P3G681_9APHY|nr:hypothetical protein PsYK624_050690 [Phanerochaete sordida]